ncbi:hypothetical protein CC86DRAFT_408393 [Ophiobolus disseminans]|uniref:Uncharacterized protein n=1 Tax=Ophiobolus disseminans TaxID=1469910 RepID=A0A6A6ZTB0_9PLEO|nr:hypothetical protein CC86DRAFT_408393 [Ophiobolus disseminans]
MKSIIVLSLASSTLAVPFGSLLDAIFVRRGEVPARRGIPSEEYLSDQDLPYGTGYSSAYSSVGTGIHTYTATGPYPTASGGASMSYQPYPNPHHPKSKSLSVTYGLPPKSTPVEVPDESPEPTPEPTPEASSTPPKASAGMPTIITTPIVVPTPSVVPTPIDNPGIPTLGSPGKPTQGQPGMPVCGQAGKEYCASVSPAPSPSDVLPNYSSYAGPDITPNPSDGYAYPTGTGYPGTGYHGTGMHRPSSTLKTYVMPSPSPSPEPGNEPENDEDEGEGYGDEKRGLWRRVEDEVRQALGFGGGKSEMSP